MLLWKERLENCPVMSLQTGGQLGVANQPIIDPRDLRVVAFYVTGPQVDVHPAVLHTSDIREFGSLGMIVNDSDDIMALDEELVRLNEIISYHFELVGMKVIDTDRNKLGKIVDYVVDTTSFMVSKFNVKAPLLHVGAHAGDLLIGRQQIREITDDHIVVAAPTIETPAEAPAVQEGLAPFENPFRQPHTEGNPATHHNSQS
ncbi:PRC-barrel domain-containing protein [Candidatus Saccharibacteria bacterium]|nr:PRC-barrel domain-containing protein [Candidatus Saccharibacteria bacterium]